LRFLRRRKKKKKKRKKKEEEEDEEEEEKKKKIYQLVKVLPSKCNQLISPTLIDNAAKADIICNNKLSYFYR